MGVRGGRWWGQGQISATHDVAKVVDELPVFALSPFEKRLPEGAEHDVSAETVDGRRLEGTAILGLLVARKRHDGDGQECGAHGDAHAWGDLDDVVELDERKELLLSHLFLVGLLVDRRRSLAPHDVHCHTRRQHKIGSDCEKQAQRMDARFDSLRKSRGCVRGL